MSSLSQLDIAGLRLLIAVIECGTISAGAARCHLSVAAASKRVLDLEGRLGVRLLERGPRGVHATPAGEVFVAHARQMVASAGALEEDLRDYARGIEGRIRVLANASAILQFLPGDLAGYMASHPRIRIDLEEHTSSDIAELIAAGRAELGILEASHVPTGIPSRPYRDDCLVLAVPNGHALADTRSVYFAETLDHDHVGLHMGTAILSRMQKAAAEHGRALRLRIQVRSFETICRMVESGIGLGVLPRQAVETYVALKRLKVVVLRDDWAQRQMVMAWPASSPPAADTQGLLDWLHASVTTRQDGRQAGAPLP